MQQKIAHVKCFALVAAGFLVSIAGCSGSNAVKVSGAVKAGGVPVERGMIRFEPADNLGPTAEAVVTDGHYEMNVPPGAKKVSVQAFKKVGQVPIGGPGGPMTDKTEQIFPDKYSDPKKTELKVDISGAASDVDFNLDAPAAKK